MGLLFAALVGDVGMMVLSILMLVSVVVSVTNERAKARSRCIESPSRRFLICLRYVG